MVMMILLLCGGQTQGLNYAERSTTKLHPQPLGKNILALSGFLAVLP
jgi:hypothetical protein